MSGPVPFVGGSDELATRKADAQRTVNMTPTRVESGSGKSNLFLKSIPGLTVFSAPPVPPHICVEGPNWLDRTIGAGLWNALEFGDGKVVAGGSNLAGDAIVCISNDKGNSWGSIITPPGMFSGGPVKKKGLAYGNGVYVAWGNGLTHATSTNGVTWTQRSHPAMGFDYLSYGSQSAVFVACASSSDFLLRSVDGVTMTPRSLPASAGWSCLAEGNGRWIALADDQSAISTDGALTWSSGGSPYLGPSIGFVAMAFGNGTFVALRNDVTDRVLYSNDAGVTWQLSSVLPVLATLWRTLLFRQGAFLAYDISGSGVLSTDGITWSVAPPITMLGGSEIWSAEGDGEGHYAAVSTLAGGTTKAAVGVC